MSVALRSCASQQPLLSFSVMHQIRRTIHFVIACARAGCSGGVVITRSQLGCFASLDYSACCRLSSIQDNWRNLVCDGNSKHVLGISTNAVLATSFCRRNHSPHPRQSAFVCIRHTNSDRRRCCALHANTAILCNSQHNHRQHFGCDFVAHCKTQGQCRCWCITSRSSGRLWVGCAKIVCIVAAAT